MDIVELRKNNLFVGRAATAIYLILKTTMYKKEIIVPSNICYAAIYPIIYSENIPVFVDVDPNTGNTNFEKILKKINRNTGAIIFPYMYGNVSKEILKLKEYCTNHNIILIEDCASAMGASISDYKAGEIGDYSIFSTGHAKIVDVGNGGILLTDNNIEPIIEEYNQLDLYNKNIEDKLIKFSKKYRQLRNMENDEEIKVFFKENYKELFLYKIDKLIIDKMKNGIMQLDNILEERHKKYNLFIKYLDKCRYYKILEYEEGSTPWRFTIIVEDQELRKKLIETLLKNNLFVSDWYPCIGKSFSNQNYTNSDYMEKRILNFSLTDDEANILKICKMINNFFEGEK